MEVKQIAADLFYQKTMTTLIATLEENKDSICVVIMMDNCNPQTYHPELTSKEKKPTETIDSLSFMVLIKPIDCDARPTTGVEQRPSVCTDLSNLDQVTSKLKDPSGLTWFNNNFLSRGDDLRQQETDPTSRFQCDCIVTLQELQTY